MNGFFEAQLLAAVLAAVGSLFKAIRFVHEGELGIKLRFGKARRDKSNRPLVINPGFVFLIPFVDTLKRRHVRQQTLRLDNQRIMVARGLIFDVSAVMLFRVKDIYRALFEIDDLDNSLGDLSMGILRDVLACKEYSELSDMETIGAELLQRLREKSEEWGVDFKQFKLTNCAPTAETAPLVNAEAGVRFKVDALKAAAEAMGIGFAVLPPVLAAALVGVPLVTAVTPEVHNNQPPKEDDDEGTIFKYSHRFSRPDDRQVRLRQVPAVITRSGDHFFTIHRRSNRALGMT